MYPSGANRLYVAELQELFSMEGQLADALERMAEVASHPSLKSALVRDGALDHTSTPVEWTSLKPSGYP